MSYVTLEEKTTDEKTTKIPQEILVKMSDELNADKIIVVDANHPLIIAAEKASKAYDEGKLLSVDDIIGQIERGEFE